MNKKLTMIHTSAVLMAPLRELASRIMPDVQISNILDDTLLPEVLREGGVTASVARRIALYVMAAETAGCDAVLNVCSSVGEAYDAAAALVRVPVIKIDEAMARKAVQIGGTIGVLATLQTTLDPTCRLIERFAREKGKGITLKRRLSDEAFQALISGDSGKHDRLVSAAIVNLAKTCDSVVLAQGSMARIVPAVKDRVSVPVLSSPESGLRLAAKVLRETTM